MYLGKTFFFLLLTGLILTVGCGDSQNESQTGKEKVPDISTYEVALLDQPALQKLISQRNGRILLINVWATWCIPCREEFPDLVRLTTTFQDRPVDVVAISADYPDEIDSKVIPFLQSQQVNFPVYVQNFERQEDFINFLNREWSGALPASFIYSISGEQKFFLLGKQSYLEFSSAIENEL